MHKKKSVEIYIEENLNQLPVHATYWKVNKIEQRNSLNEIKSSTNNGIIAKDLMYKPVSTFFKLSINARK